MESVWGALIGAFVGSGLAGLVTLHTQKKQLAHAQEMQQAQWDKESNWRREDQRHQTASQLRAFEAARIDQKAEWARRDRELKAEQVREALSNLRQSERESVANLQTALQDLSYLTSNDALRAPFIRSGHIEFGLNDPVQMVMKDGWANALGRVLIARSRITDSAVIVATDRVLGLGRQLVDYSAEAKVDLGGRFMEEFARLNGELHQANRTAQQVAGEAYRRLSADIPLPSDVPDSSH